jgi:hypothetical protein
MIFVKMLAIMPENKKIPAKTGIQKEVNMN